MHTPMRTVAMAWLLGSAGCEGDRKDAMPTTQGGSQYEDRAQGGAEVGPPSANGESTPRAPVAPQ